MRVMRASLAALKPHGDLRDGLVAMAIALGASFSVGAGAIGLADRAAISYWFGDGSVLRPKPSPMQAALNNSKAAAVVKTERKAPAPAPAIVAAAAPARPAADSVLFKLASMGFSFDAVQAGFRHVPRLFLTTLPGDIAHVGQPEKRKAVFVGTLLPLILRVNENILTDRQRVLDLRDQERRGQEPSDADREWMGRLALRYGAARADYATLLLHVDAVPPSLALAQAAEESGWGTSRFAADGNALFGQRVWKRGAGITPAERARGARFEVRAFARLESSVASYIHNLNSHSAYGRFRDERAASRKVIQPQRGEPLVAHLERYSERGADYVESLRNIIRDNDFGRFDSARLRPPEPARVAVALSDRH